MNWLDIVILVVFSLAAFWGYKRGFVSGVALICGSVLGIYLGLNFSEVVAEHLKNNYTNNSYFLITLAFVLIFLLVYASFWFVGKLISKALKIIQLSILNRVLGSVLYILSSVFLMGSLFLLIGTPRNGSNTFTSIIPLETRDASSLYFIVGDMSRTMLPFVENSTDEVYNILKKE